MPQEIVIDAFKAGAYPQGTFGAKELSEIASTYDPENYEAPILIGHLSDPSYKGKSTIPAFGWIGKAKVVGDHLKLVASQFSEQLKQFIKEGFYKKVSAAFFQPDDPNNPTPGKWHLHHLAFLGGAPPAVKGLEQIAFADFSLKGLGIEFAEMETDVMVDGEMMKVKEMGIEDTMEDMAEYCGNFLKKCEDVLSSDAEPSVKRERANLALTDMQSEIRSCMDEHFGFMSKLEKVAMSEKPTFVQRMLERVQSIITKRKESNVDAKKEQEYQEQITSLTEKNTALDTQVKEFTEQKRLADEAKAIADQEAQAAALKATEEAQKGEIKTFCEAKIKEGKMTPAMQTTDEPIMVSLAKIPEALKAFQEKYTVQLVSLGEVTELNEQVGNDTRSQVIKDAEKYVAAHSQEFADVPEGLKVQRAIFLAAQHKIKFESK